MTPWNVIVAAFDDAPSSASALRARLLDAWSGAAPITVDLAAVQDVEDLDLSTIDAVVILADRPDEAVRVMPLLSVLEEAHVPTMVLVGRARTGAQTFEFAGALVEPVTTDGELVCAKLNGLLHRQREVRRLRREVEVSDRFHGGLRGEIARMHDELQLAAIVQRDFLPRELPSLYGVDFGSLWRPAHYVSGDIYDVVRLDHDHVGMFIADAVGHGVPAALMTMVISRALVTKVITGSSYHLVEPEEVMHRLNQDMIRRRGLGTTRFATGAYALINCRTRLMRFAGAGHPPPMLQRADGTLEELETDGGLLGIFEDETYDQIEVELGVGDRLIMHSDGFEQAFPQATADAYEQRLPTMRYREEFIRLAEAGTPGDMVRTLARRLDDQRGSLHQVDDLTMVCMHAGPLPAAEPAATRAAHRAAL